MPHHHVQHTQNMGSNLFACNENSAYTMSHVTACPVTSCMHCAVNASRQASCPYVYVACQELLMDMPFAPAELYVSKLTASHFGTLNTKIANQNVLKMILIALHNENKADCNENFRLCAEEPMTSVPGVSFNRHVGTEIFQ